MSPLASLNRDPGLAVAWAHLTFNVTVATGFLTTLDLVEPRLRRWLSVETERQPTQAA